MWKKALMMGGAAIMMLTSIKAADVVKIGVLKGERFKSFRFEPIAGRFLISQKGNGLINGYELCYSVEPEKNKKFISIYKDRIATPAGILKTEKNGIFIKGTESSSFRLYIDGKRKPLMYHGNLFVSINNDGTYRLINEVSLEALLPGVLKAENNGMNEPEYLKAMAITSRTYALNNLYRHKGEGFDLCDKTHCQAYFGSQKEDSCYIDAVRETRGQVIVDKDGQLINAVFHSNSGGVTVASEDIWGEHRSYLRPVRDPYSLKGRSGTWSVKYSREEWKKYLAGKTSLDAGVNCDSTFSQRRVFICGEKILPVMEVKKELGLQTSFFDIQETEDSIYFNGRGFGHGVGLSQEGAYEMAKKGRKYDKIIYFYYTGVTITNLEAI